MSDLVRKYKLLFADPEAYNMLFSIGKGSGAKMYSYVGTNYRSTKAFYRNFRTFKEIEGIPRANWPSSAHGQEKHKQHVVNMLASKFFESRNSVFTRTTKGTLYDEFLDKEEFTSKEKWIINYVFLLDSYLESTSNYIFEWTSKLMSDLSVVYTKSQVFTFLREFFPLNKRNTRDVFYSDFFIMHSFYSNIEFLEAFKSSSPDEKDALKEYIFQNKNQELYEDPISKKYINGGNFNSSMLEDEAKVMYLTSVMMDFEGTYDQFIERLLDVYSRLYTIDATKVLDYLKSNSDIFEVIYLNIYNLEVESQTEEDGEEVDTDSLEDTPEAKIDDTTKEGKKELDLIFQRRKKIAREQANYTCELHTLNNCRHFTSKATRKNYVEVHHLIPKEFRNDFEYSLDVLANYVSLCPHCHRMIHLAVDRERQSLLHHLYNNRKERLMSVGLPLDIDKLYIYNKVTEL